MKPYQNNDPIIDSGKAVPHARRNTTATRSSTGFPPRNPVSIPKRVCSFSAVEPKSNGAFGKEAKAIQLRDAMWMRSCAQANKIAADRRAKRLASK